MLYVREAWKGNAVEFHDEHGRNQQTKSHQHFVIDDLVVVFRFGLHDDPIHRFLDDESSQIQQQNANRQQKDEGEPFAKHGGVVWTCTHVAEEIG